METHTPSPTQASCRTWLSFLGCASNDFQKRLFNHNVTLIIQELVFKNCANVHNNLTDYLIKEEPKYCLLLYIQLLLSHTAKKKKEKRTKGCCVDYQLMKAILTHSFYVTAFNKKTELDLKILHCSRAIHKIRSYLQLNKNEPTVLYM